MKNSLPFQIGFVIPHEMIPGRMTLLVILFLTLLTIFMGIMSTSPKTIGNTNIMNWMIGCMTYVFVAVIEYGIILFFKFLIKYKSLPQDYAQKKLMQVDLICLLTSIVSFTLFTIIFFASSI